MLDAWRRRSRQHFVLLPSSDWGSLPSGLNTDGSCAKAMGLGTAEPLKSRDVIKAYRYLRIGMIGAVLLLAVSILIERSKVDCWQRSISAYY
jgi:hypothetical protein